MVRSIQKVLLALVAVFIFINPSLTTAETAPKFVLQGPDKTIQLSKYKGRVVYVDFWASWCEPCRRSFAWMNKMQSLYGKDNFSIIAINLDESRQDANKFLQQTPAAFDIAYDPGGKIAEAYQLKVMPSSFLVDARGELVARSVGFRSETKDKLEQQIKQLLSEDVLASNHAR